jgi:hypothetical protein
MDRVIRPFGLRDIHGLRVFVRDAILLRKLVQLGHLLGKPKPGKLFDELVEGAAAGDDQDLSRRRAGVSPCVQMPTRAEFSALGNGRPYRSVKELELAFEGEKELIFMLMNVGRRASEGRACLEKNAEDSVAGLAAEEYVDAAVVSDPELFFYRHIGSNLT